MIFPPRFALLEDSASFNHTKEFFMQRNRNTQLRQVGRLHKLTALLCLAIAVPMAQGQVAPPLLIENRAVPEGNSGTTVVRVRVTRPFSSPTAAPIVVNYLTQDGSATSGSDYLAANGSVTLTPAAPSAEIALTINGDTTPEPDEAFMLALTPAGSMLPPVLGRIGIINDDGITPPPGGAFVVRGEAVREGNSGTTPLRFRIARGTASTGDLVLSYRTEDDTATSPSDYQSATGTVTLTAASPFAEVTINVQGDTQVEPFEQFKFIVSDGATPANTQMAPGLIADDDGAPMPPIGLLAIPLDALAVEPSSADAEVRLGVRLSRPSSTPITIQYAAAPGATATAGTDFTGATSGSLVFAAGETLKQITFRVNADNEVEGREFAKFNLTSTDSSVQLPRPFVQLSIVDRRDTPPVNPPLAVIVPCKPFVREDAGSARLVVKRVGSTDAALAIKYQSVDGTALAGSDYTASMGDLTWTAGNAELKLVEVPILDDDVIEPFELFRVKLTNAAGAALPGRSEAPIAIVDGMDHFSNHDFDDLCESEADGTAELGQ
jgi:hypothetical protein